MTPIEIEPLAPPQPDEGIQLKMPSYVLPAGGLRLSVGPLAPPGVRVVLVMLGYLAVVVWLTWPLAVSPLTHLPCAGVACAVDTLYSAWVLAWESHALGTSPLHLTHGNIYYPAPNAVLYGPTGLGALPYFAPIYAISGSATFALNATLLLCVALTAAGLHLVVLRWTGRHSAGAVAAAVLLTSRWLLWGFVGTAPHLAALQYFPFIVLLAAMPRPGNLGSVVLFALVVLQCLTDPIYVAPAVLAPLGVLASSRLCRRASRAEGVRLTLVIVAAVVTLAPLYLLYLQVRESNPDLAVQSLWRGKERGLDLANLFWRGRRSTTVAPAALGLVLAGAALAFLRRLPRRAAPPHDRELPHGAAWRHAALWTVVGTLLSLPPQVALGGHTLVVPHTLLDEWTSFYDVIRGPSRLGVAGLMGLCLLAGLGYAEIAGAFARLFDRRYGQAVQATIGAMALGLVYWIPPGSMAPLPARFPLRVAPVVPAAFQPILDDGREPLVQLPALRRDGSRPLHLNADAMFRSISHWRPILNGYSSYWPAGFIDRMRLAERLPSRSALIALVRRYGLGLVWVDVRSYPPEKRLQWARTRRQAHDGLSLLAMADGQMLFAVALSELDEGGSGSASSSAQRKGRGGGSPRGGS